MGWGLHTLLKRDDLRKKVKEGKESEKERRVSEMGKGTVKEREREREKEREKGYVRDRFLPTQRRHYQRREEVLQS